MVLKRIRVAFWVLNEGNWCCVFLCFWSVVVPGELSFLPLLLLQGVECKLWPNICGGVWGRGRCILMVMWSSGLLWHSLGKWSEICWVLVDPQPSALALEVPEHWVSARLGKCCCVETPTSCFSEAFHFWPWPKTTCWAGRVFQVWSRQEVI